MKAKVDKKFERAVKEYGKYLAEISVERATMAQKCVANGWALSFQAWRRQHYAPFYKEMEQRQQAEVHARLIAHYQKPLEVRLKEEAIKDMKLILGQIVRERQELEEAVDELAELEAMEELGGGMFS